MWQAFQRFMGLHIGKIGAVSIKGVHVVVVATVLAAGTGVGAGVYIVTHNASTSQARTVVVTINGVTTSLDAKCQYHFAGESGGTFDAIDQGLVKEGFTDPYQQGCPSSTGSAGSGFGSLLDIAEYSYAASPGHMANGHGRQGTSPHVRPTPTR